MATITAGDIYLGSSFTVGSNTRNTFSITEQNFIQSSGPSPQNTNLIFYNKNSQFYTPRWNLANSSINISTVPGQIRRITTQPDSCNSWRVRECSGGWDGTKRSAATVFVGGLSSDITQAHLHVCHLRALHACYDMNK